jgi:hypothetical protein
MKSGLIVAATLILSALQLSAQEMSDRAQVRQAALDYIEGFYEGDTTRFVRSVSSRVEKYGYERSRGTGSYTGSAMPLTEFFSFANSIKNGEFRTPPNAPKEVEILDVLDQTAVAKITAWWGTDYLSMAKEDGRWKILQVLWQNHAPRPFPVEGTYHFAKAYVSNSCGEDRELVNQSAVVTHERRSHRFVFDDGVVRFVGTVDPDGAFRTDPVSGQDANMNSLGVVLEGMFRTDGFDALLQVNQVGPEGSAPEASCAYTIRWTGTLEPAAGS